jgi:hypothetical protein
VTILLTTFLLALPLAPAPVLAAPNVTVGQSNAADPGGSFTASLMVSGAQNIGAMDVRVTFNPNVLTVVSASLGHTIWDLNNNGIISDDPVLVVRHDVFPTIGLIRYALTFVGGVSVSPSAPASMLDINYIVNNPPGLTATDLPSMVSMQSAALVVETPSGPSTVIPSTTDLSYSPPAYLVPQSVGCRATNPGFNVHAKGFTDGLFCRVINSGSISIQALADFPFQSLNGVTGDVRSDIVTLAPGQFAELTATITVPNAVDIFILNGTPMRAIAMPDGTNALIAAQSVPLFINVNTA